MNVPTLLPISAVLAILACVPSVSSGQCGSVTPVDGTMQTISDCPEISEVKTVYGHCYDDSGSVVATPSGQLYGSGECDNNRSYTPPDSATYTCELDLICGPIFSDSVAGISGGYHVAVGVSRSRLVNWLHSPTGVYPTDCLQNGCENGVQNTAIVPCPDMCPGDPPPGGGGPDEEEEQYDPNSPLVLDFGKRGFSLSSLEDGVEFDIDGDGSIEWISWTNQGSEDAFLALDRNQNGIIDNGTELFGDATDQPISDSPNGFAALSVFDEPAWGGNGDGRISDSDEVFSELWLWVDWSHDGYSDAIEMTRLSASDVLWIDLDFRESRRRDRHGNELRYMSRYFDEESTRRWVTDVFFLSGGDQ